MAACKESENAFSELTPQEIAALQQRAQQKCLNDAAKDFEDVSATSNEKLLDMQKGDYWKVTLASSTTTRNMRVWKVSGNNVYFLYYDPSIGSNLFIKMNTTINAEMFEFLKKKKCETIKAFKITQSSGAVTIKREDVPSTQDSDQYNSDFTYTAKNSLPAYFSSFSYTERKEKLNDDREVVSTENLTNKIAYVERNTDVLYPSFTNYSPRKFCIMKYSGIGSTKVYTFPFETVCSDTDGSNPNTSGDPLMDFTSAEL